MLAAANTDIFGGKPGPANESGGNPHGGNATDQRGKNCPAGTSVGFKSSQTEKTDAPDRKANKSCKVNTYIIPLCE